MFKAKYSAVLKTASENAVHPKSVGSLPVELNATCKQRGSTKRACAPRLCFQARRALTALLSGVAASVLCVGISFAAPTSGNLPAGMLPLPAPPNAATSSTLGASSKASTSNRPIVSRDYVLDVDDQVAIESITHKEISYQGDISSDGKINVPQLGQIVARGRTIPQLEREILRRMSSVGFLNSMVSVTLRQARPQRVFVLKAKGGAGVVEIKPGWRISDVLALSSGLGDLPPDLVDATLTRPRTAKPIVLDLPSIMRDSNSRANILVESGDTLRIVSRTVQISFAGKVARSGNLEVPIGSSIVEAVALAGGTTTKAALTRASLKRSTGEIIPLNLYNALVKGLPGPDVKLQDGDLIVVPEAQERVTVQGAVGNPGYYDIEDGKVLKLSEVIALAGGPSAKGAITRTIVQRADGTSRIIDLFRVLALHEEENNIELKSDDIITIPEYTPQVMIAGAGARASTYVPIEEGTTLRILGALTKAGGLSNEPEATRITITRNIPNAVPTLDKGATNLIPTTLTVDPVKLYKQSDLESNIALQDGDLVMVTVEPRKIYLAGEVRSPGVYEIEGNEGLTEILTRAGGITDEGLLSAVVVERGGTKHTVDVFKALTSGEDVHFPLQAGDNVVVPENMNRVLILPGVGKPGYHAIPEDRPMTVPEALSLASGTSADAELKKVVLLRQTPQGLKSQPLPLDSAEQYIAASKVVMKPGDILFVPKRDVRTGRTLAQKILGVMPFSSMLFGSPFPLF